MNPTAPATIDVLREGERDGSRTLLRIKPVDGPAFHAAAVPQDWYSYTGPTWIYIIEGQDGLTLIDSASGVVVEHLTDAFREIGIDPSSLRRVIITHGHVDHDGGALLLAREWGVEVWAHLLWDTLRFYERAELEGEGYSLVQEALDEDGRTSNPLDSSVLDEDRARRRDRYAAMRQQVNLGRLVDHGDQAADLTFYHTPGHAPDELTIASGTVLFAGDHILPEITPHASAKGHFPAGVLERLPAQYRDVNQYYGLNVFLRSLLMIAAMGDEALVMPAHRLINRGKLNLITATRARVIVDHHAERVERILEIMGSTTWSVGELTKALFAHRSLDGVYHQALSETMAHIELLEGSGDIVKSPENRFTWSGSQRYLSLLQDGER